MSEYKIKLIDENTDLSSIDIEPFNWDVVMKRFENRLSFGRRDQLV